MTNLVKKWEKYKKQNFSQTELSNFPYKNNIAQTLQLALCFWNFFKNEIQGYEDVPKKEFLMKFVNNSNTYIALIAKIEMLPATIWRKCLWRYNIDFLSLESFLRRITPEQIKLIENNWDDLYAITDGKLEEFNETPSVLYESFFDRLKISLYVICSFFGIVKLLPKRDNSLYSRNRYLSKSAWTENLAYLDFGFGLYAEGLETDDKKETKISQFLSVKNHVNDFVVNQEDGIYWFFYRFTRSFGGLKHWNSIQLSPWICPGFWATISMMVWFIIGPFIGLPLLSSSGFVFITGLLLSAPFIAWCIIVGFASIIILILVLNDLIGSKIQKIIRPMFYASIGLLVITIISFIAKILWEVRNFFVSLFEKIGLIDPHIGSLILILTSLYTIGMIMHHYATKAELDDEEISKEMVDNKWLQKTLLIYSSIWIILAILLFRVEILNILITILSSIWSNLFSILLLVLFGISFIYIFIGSIANDNKLLKIKNTFELMIPLNIASYIGLSFVWFDGFLLYPTYSEMNIFYLFGLITLIALSFNIILSITYLNEEVIRKKEYVDIFMYNSYWIFNIEYDQKKSYLNMYQRIIARNQNLNAENLDIIFDHLYNIARTCFDDFFRTKFFTLALSKGDEKSIFKLKNLFLGAGKNRVQKELQTNIERIQFAEAILNGLSLKDALVYAKQKAQKEMIRKENTRKVINTLQIVFSWVATKILWVFTPIIVVLKFLGKVISNLYSLWLIMYKEACPYVQQPKQL